MFVVCRSQGPSASFYEKRPRWSGCDAIGTNLGLNFEFCIGWGGGCGCGCGCEVYKIKSKQIRVGGSGGQSYSNYIVMHNNKNNIKIITDSDLLIGIVSCLFLVHYSVFECSLNVLHYECSVCS